ncbi:MAG: Xaa-Pro peptidase family protein [Armatimonadota bacterium]|nr:Xaa-Pro peptidase family protein [Armatimonadota bacterium]MDR7448283.1 Xaa-Pro peptidase family protein [Armatimonadota bacterium]MDR7458313.1 Xaa-Pro peptidase family protein [Armatimonadota bacterium]MDR7478384.1 Xaa-Pro peptidase family protein [Armatimonadota bacterium]MDR7487318.1 Xaa-Pro peptidase family protein [Armatimonadota bacterium]
MPEEIRRRQREAMARLGLAAMVIVAPENVCWTTGALIPSQRTVRHRHAIALVPGEGEAELFVVDVEEGFARAHADVARVTAYNEFTQRPVLVLAEAIRARGLRGAVGVEAAYLNYADYRLLEQALDGVAHLVPVDEVLAALRMVKTPEELARLRRAAQVAEQAAHAGLQTWWPGMTEADLGRRIADAFSAAGGENLTMLSVTAGERTPMLNGPPTRREIRPGEVVRIDVIGTVQHYVCDVARTAVVGPPTPEQEALWGRLVECRHLALDLIRPGASTRAIFRAYIEKMDAWRLPTLHFLGHGLGLTLHEEPYLNRYADTTLEEGMVLAIEPLVTLPALGMQLEETVIVTATGCEVATCQYDVGRLWQMVPGDRP